MVCPRPRRASISISTYSFLRPYILREYSRTIFATSSFLYVISQRVLRSNGRLDALSILSLQYVVKFAIPMISCCERTGAYSFSRYSASSAPTLKDMIVPAFPKTASLIDGLSPFFAPFHQIWAINWCAIMSARRYLRASDSISQKVSVAKF